MARNSNTVAEAIINASAIVDNHTNLIEQIKSVLANKSGGNLTGLIEENTALVNEIASLIVFTGRPEARYLWLKLDEQDGNIIELLLGNTESEYPSDTVGDDGYYYQRVTHVLCKDKNNDTYILEI